MSPEDVRQALRSFASTCFSDVLVVPDEPDNPQVTMSFRDLCSLIDEICASMSEADSTGYAEFNFRRQVEIAQISNAVFRRSKTV